jgi:hypothetical protein
MTALVFQSEVEIRGTIQFISTGTFDPAALR